MNRLILFRHAKTERRAPSGDDFDRRLTDRGRADAALIGRVLGAAGITPDVVLLSPAVRAKETWSQVAELFPGASVVEKPLLYAADADEILRLVEGRPEPAVMVIGHNPSLHVLASELDAEQGGRGPSLRDGFPTAAAAVFEFGGPETRLSGFYTPSAYGGGPDD
jgi:phosphohistidine phosphatase